MTWKLYEFQILKFVDICFLSYKYLYKTRLNSSVDCKALNTYCLALYRKSLQIPGLEEPRT